MNERLDGKVTMSFIASVRPECAVIISTTDFYYVEQGTNAKFNLVEVESICITVGIALMCLEGV